MAKGTALMMTPTLVLTAVASAVPDGVRTNSARHSRTADRSVAAVGRWIGPHPLQDSN
jgi:hypothetical protein